MSHTRLCMLSIFDINYLSSVIIGKYCNFIGLQECDLSIYYIHFEINGVSCKHPGFKHQSILRQMWYGKWPKTNEQNLHVMNDLKLRNFFAHKNKLLNTDSYSKLSKNWKFSNFTNSNRKIKNIIFYQISSKRQQKQI
jgi:hypothetical protein